VASNTAPAAALPVGTYTVTAVYSGSVSFNASTGTLSPVATVTVSQASSSMLVNSSVASTFYGQTGATITAKVSDSSSGSSGTPTGTVQFQTNGVNFGGAVTLVSGIANAGALPATLPAGSYTVTATYSGSANFTTSSVTLSPAQTVSQASSSTAVVSSSNPSQPGQSNVTFTATVSDSTISSTGTPTGTVQFKTNGVNFGSAVTLVSGSASSVALPTNLPAGNYAVTAAYSGDGNFITSSGTLSGGQTVSGGAGAPVLTSIHVAGTTLSITATNGVPNGPYTLLQSSNLALPAIQWTPVSTGTFNGSGNLTLSTNIVNPANTDEFYILSQ
jgi:large repetitive protein